MGRLKDLLTGNHPGPTYRYPHERDFNRAARHLAADLNSRRHRRVPGSSFSAADPKGVLHNFKVLEDGKVVIDTVPRPGTPTRNWREGYDDDGDRYRHDLERAGWVPGGVEWSMLLPCWLSKVGVTLC